MIRIGLTADHLRSPAASICTALHVAAFPFVAISDIKPGKIHQPGVLGAYIFLGDCFDLLDVQYTAVLEAVFPAFVADLENRGEPIPQNDKPRADGTKLLHALDRAVIEFAIRVTEKTEGRKFDTVRGAFWEGGPAFPGSELSKRSHIQIAVRNPECVVGYFKPKRG